ncbi:MAG: hypothetical protein ACRD2B_18520 [Terriglobia bacterium]
MRILTRPLIVTLFLSLIAPAFTCAAAPAPSRHAMDCCRTMKDSCHKNQSEAKCCVRHASELTEGAFIPAARVEAAPPALTTVALLSPAGLAALQRNMPFGSVFNFKGHSPPPTTSLYILHSILLI